MQSPLKGLERLTEELKQERQKASNAMQDRARLRVEIESLKQLNDHKDSKIQELLDQSTLSQNEIQSLHEIIEKIQAEFNAVNEDMIVKNEEHGLLYDEKLRLQNENEAFRNVINEKETQIATLNLKVDSLESRTMGKDELLNKLKEEIQEFRSNQMNNEQEKLDAYAQLVEYKQLCDDLKSQLQEKTVLEDGMNQTKSSHEELRGELEQSLNSNSSHLEQIRELTYKLNDKSAANIKLEEELHKLVKERDALQKELTDVEGLRDDIHSRIQAEIEAGEAAKERAVAAARGRDFLDQQLRELRDAHRDALSYSSTLEDQLTTARTTISDQQAEITQARDKLAEAKSAMEQVEGVQAMTMEMEVLRNQLNEVRRQLIRRDVEDDAGVLAPKAVVDRELQGRQMYEGIIQELRAELDKVNHAYHETARRCEEALRQAARVEQLEEELKMYKELVRHNSIENQNAALSISEAVERSAKFSQEKHSIMHNMHRVEAELVSARAEGQRAKDEILTLREKMKTFHSGKITSDKRVAEISATNSRLEAAIEDAKQLHDRTSIEFEKSKRKVQEQAFTINELRIRMAEVDSLKADNSAYTSRIASLKSDFAKKEKELALQIETLRHHKATLQRELDAMREKVGIHRQGFEQSHGEISRVRSELEAVALERDRYKRELAVKDSLKAESQLHDLKRDLEQTVTEWQDLEKEKHVKDKMIAQFQGEMNKEKEKVALLKMQMGLLEERLRVATQELSVLRGIDVYHSSMKMELRSHREDKVASAASSSSTNKHIRSSIRNDANQRAADAAQEEMMGSSVASTPANNKLQALPLMMGDSAGGRFSLEEMENQMNEIVSDDFEVPTSIAAKEQTYQQPPMTVPSTNASIVSDLDTHGGDGRMQQQQQPPEHDEEYKSTGAGEGEGADEKEEDHNQSVDPADVDMLLQSASAINRNRNDPARHQNFSSGVVPAQGPLPADATTGSPTRAAVAEYMSAVTSSGATVTGLGSGSASGRATEREELLRRRAERKAIRDQQLRDRLVREGSIPGPMSSSGSRGYSPTTARSGIGGGSISEYGRGSNAGSISHSVKSSSNYSSTTMEGNNGRQNIPSSNSHTNNYSYNQNSTSSLRPPSPAVSTASAPASSTPARDNNMNANNDSTAARDVRRSYRPAKTDYERARRLLSM